MTRLASVSVGLLPAILLLLLNCQTLFAISAEINQCNTDFEDMYQKDGSVMTTATYKLILNCINLRLCKYSYSSESLSYVESVDRTDVKAFLPPKHPMVGSFIGDISQLDGSLYHQQFYSICNDLQGTTTTATTILDLEGTAMINVDVDFYMYLKDILVCLPASCHDQDLKQFSEVAGKKIMVGLAKTEDQNIYTDQQIDQLSGMTSRSACLFLGISTCTFLVCEDAGDCGSYHAIVNKSLGDRFSAAPKYQYNHSISAVLALTFFIYAAIML